MLKNDNKDFYIITSVSQAVEKETLDVDIRRDAEVKTREGLRYKICE